MGTEVEKIVFEKKKKKKKKKKKYQTSKEWILFPGFGTCISVKCVRSRPINEVCWTEQSFENTQIAGAAPSHSEMTIINTESLYHIRNIVSVMQIIISTV